MQLIVEADGGSRGNPGPAAYGAVVRDAENGDVLAERAEFLGRATNNVAEYRGLIAGLEAARDIDPRAHVEARLDSRLVVEQMSGRWKIKHPDMRPLALRARDVLPAEQVTYVWVPREQNRHADRLANEAMDAGARGETWSPTSSSDQGVQVDEAEVEPPPANVLRGWAGDSPPTTFLLLRHGETPHTVEKRFSGSGHADPELTAVGREQARRAAAALAGRSGIDAVVSSPLRRARQTAEVAASLLGLEVRVADGLAECDFGEWDGHTFAEVQERWPDQLAAWLSSTSVPPPGGESFDQVERRVRRTLDQLRTRYAQRTVLVVTHVTPVKTFVRLALDAPPSAVYRMELRPASLSEIQWYADGGASLRGFNDASYLDDDSTA